ncbi:MAG: MBL fold metallo-hydrolase [Candidatus Micrarchaeota archaeon]|nr:MBL fold metallo-hydrolase [Candidatus Micrarchaeota archaeon]
MKYAAILIFLASILLAGCFGINFPGSENNSVVTNTTGNLSVTNASNSSNGIIIISQTNTSAELNQSEKPPEENGTIVIRPEENVTPGAHYSETPNDRFAVYFINVGDNIGQGDAIFVKRGDFDMLIDAGPTRNSNLVVDFLKRRGIDDIDVLVSTHADEEHYGGMDAVLDNFPVEEFWWTGKSYDDAVYGSLVQKVTDNGALIKIVKRGDDETFNSLNFHIMNPKEGSTFSDSDNNAIVTKITNGDFCILLTSDITSSVSSDLVNTENVTCSLLQLPYHGLGKGNFNVDLFLLKVNPSYVFVSGGSYDPSQDGRGTRPPVFAKLNLRSISYMENYNSGTIKIESDGVSYSVENVD